MPYTIGKDASCPASKPHAVKKVGGGVVPGGCHATPEKAQAHHAALMANVPDAKRGYSAQQREQASVVAGLVEQTAASKPPGELSLKERLALAKKGQAQPDGSFPIRNLSDLTQHAMPSFGRASDKGSVKRWLFKRAKELGAGQDIIKRIAAFST